MIFIDKPFSVGHWITSGDLDGTVEEVGFRSTRIRTFRNSLTYVPNGKLADSTIDNHGLKSSKKGMKCWLKSFVWQKKSAFATI